MWVVSRSGFGHLVVVGHGHLHLRVGGFRQEREEHDEIFVPIDRLGDVTRAALFEVRIRNRQLGLGQVFAVRVGIDQRLQPQSPDLVTAMLDVIHGFVIQLLVRLDRIRSIRRLINRFLLMNDDLGGALAGHNQPSRTHEKKRKSPQSSPLLFADLGPCRSSWPDWEYPYLARTLLSIT